MKTSVLALLCVAHVALGGVASVNKRCHPDDKSCNEAYKSHSCQPNDKSCNQHHRGYSCQPNDLSCKQNCRHDDPSCHPPKEYKEYGDECFLQVAQRGYQAVVDCNNFLGKATIAGNQVTVTAVSIATGLVTVTSRPTVYSIVGSINKRTALPEAVPAAPSVLPRMPDGYRVYNPGATEYVAPTAKVKRQWGNNGWGDQWDRFSPENSWTGIPRYASACASRSEYANACYRYGATGGTVIGGSQVVTVTVTQMVQATTTLTVPVTSAVCDPANGFGLHYRGGYETNGMQQTGLSVNFPTFPDTTTPGGCCAKCFLTTGCMIWFIDAAFANRCSLYVSTGGVGSDATSHCPNGFASTFSLIDATSAATFGLGACTNYMGIQNN